ncbi:MAG TPA: hypothetical protein VM866_04705 [Pyrinomonadaceae bacterium]|nr:hypothetical protein [Pyrinomonadaceae bacterium]
MTIDHTARNRALVRYLLLPTIFLTVALLGGLRVAAGTQSLTFVAPTLITLFLALLLIVLFVRGRALDVSRWLSGSHHPLTNVSHALTLAALFFASAQSFNSVLPERGLFRPLFSFFFLWTLWNNLFSSFDARRLVRSLAALFATAFVLKHMLLASLYDAEGGWLKRLAGLLVEGITLGTIDAPQYAPASGYISFFTILLYVGGLVLLPAAPYEDNEADAAAGAQTLVRAYRQLSPSEKMIVLESLQPGKLNSQSAMNESDAGELLIAGREPDASESVTEGVIVPRESSR